MTKIRFKNARKDVFFKELKRRVNKAIEKENLMLKAKVLLWAKLFFYLCLFLGAYLFLICTNISAFPVLVGTYIVIGMSGILLAFNAAHDACHNTFSKKRWVNNLIYTLSFNLQGVNAYLWRIRHISSHHVFPNVDGCDADIDDNYLLKLSPSKTTESFHRYQHLYATFLYCFYTLHWILIKDFIYLKKTELANLKNLHHPIAQVIALFGWKIFYFLYMIVVPLYCGYSWSAILPAFLIMHVVISLFFVWSLIISHLTMETQFHVADEQGVLPFDYAKHQLSVSLDYHPTSYLANWVFGGFNSHAAHHLFPHLPHTAYVRVSEIIKKITREHNYPYNELPLLQAIGSHYRFLKKIGNP